MVSYRLMSGIVHRYELNHTYLESLESSGLIVSGRSEDKILAEMVEWPEHPWFLACQFHPEFLSSPLAAHPLFISFIQAARQYKNKIVLQAADQQGEVL